MFGRTEIVATFTIVVCPFWMGVMIALLQTSTLPDSIWLRIEMIGMVFTASVGTGVLAMLGFVRLENWKSAKTDQPVITNV